MDIMDVAEDAPKVWVRLNETLRFSKSLSRAGSWTEELFKVSFFDTLLLYRLTTS